MYITTAIDYMNGSPHLGHAYEKVLADTIVRWNKLMGKDVFFSVGSDEYGQKVLETAKKKGIDVKKNVDKTVREFKDFFESLNVNYDRFIRTTDEDHKKLVKKIIKQVKEDIYLGEYEGWYCKSCEAFYTNLQLNEEQCPECGKDVEKRKEKSYFFKLSKYQKQVTKIIENGLIFPESRKNEVLQRLKEPLKDLSISRLKEKMSWGINFSLDENHVVYVWFDALLNYLTSGKWPADLQIVGKDIFWFHVVIWPAMLLAMKQELPKKVFVHGFINDSNGKKMSKSLGNGINPEKIVKQYGVDAFRYYLLRTVVSGEDGNFNEKELVNRYNGDLANELGNLVQRSRILGTNFCSELKNNNFEDNFKFNYEEIDKLMPYKYDKALDLIFKYVRKINIYLNEKEPWKNEENREEIIYNVLEGIRFITTCLHPFIPNSMEKISSELNFEIKSFEFGKGRYSLKRGELIFPKIEIKMFPLDIIVGKILSVEKIEGADKLFVEQVDLGNEKRQIVSGLAKNYSPEELIGKKILVVCNLKKAKLRGVESYGMLIAGKVMVGKTDSLKVVESTSKEGTQVLPKGMTAKKEQISFNDFEKIKLEAKNGKVFADGEQLFGEEEITFEGTCKLG